MLKTTIVMNEVIVSSGFTPEEILRIKKFAPENLVVRDKDENEVFRYDYSANAEEENPISKYGILFMTTNNDGKAATKVLLPGNLETTEEKKKWIGEELGAGLRYASQMEANFSNALEEINATIDGIIDDITVIV